MRSFSLLCTYGSALKASITFPPDGTCDYIFYDSLYCPIHHNEFGEAYRGPFAAFMSKAVAPRFAEIGISVSYK